jgi:hypothetical protein
MLCLIYVTNQATDLTPPVDAGEYSLRSRDTVYLLSKQGRAHGHHNFAHLGVVFSTTLSCFRNIDSPLTLAAS